MASLRLGSANCEVINTVYLSPHLLRVSFCTSWAWRPWTGRRSAERLPAPFIPGVINIFSQRWAEGGAEAAARAPETTSGNFDGMETTRRTFCKAGGCSEELISMLDLSYASLRFTLLKPQTMQPFKDVFKRIVLFFSFNRFVRPADPIKLFLHKQHHCRAPLWWTGSFRWRCLQASSSPTIRKELL